MTRIYLGVEAYLHDFDDDAIVAEADEIMRQRGPFTTQREALAGSVSDLAFAIQSGSTADAMAQLERMVGEDRLLVDAIDQGRRRLR